MLVSGNFYIFNELIIIILKKWNMIEFRFYTKVEANYQIKKHKGPNIYRSQMTAAASNAVTAVIVTASVKIQRERCSVDHAHFQSVYYLS